MTRLRRHVFRSVRVHAGPEYQVVRECEQLPLEFVVRGYITGVTKTSAWTNYKRGYATSVGTSFQRGLRKDQKLAEPIITPTTKLDVADRIAAALETLC